MRDQAAYNGNNTKDEERKPLWQRILIRKVDSHPRSQNSPQPTHSTADTQGCVPDRSGVQLSCEDHEHILPSSDPHLGQQDEHSEHPASLVEGTNNTEDTRDKEADCDERFPSPDIHQEGTEEVSRNLNKTKEDKTEVKITVE